MIRKIEKLKNLGIFHDYKHNSDTPEFERYNLIYGWNGCGKTTLSRLFSMVEVGESDIFPGIEYSIRSEEGVFKQKQAYSRKIRAFNQDFIRDNSPSLEDPEAPTKHIFILGKEDKELASKIENDKGEMKKLEEVLAKDNKKEGVTSLKATEIRLEKAYNGIFTDIAKTIASSRGRAFRDYNRRDAMKVYESMTSKELLSGSELEKQHKLAEQKILPKLSTISFPSINTKTTQDIIDDLNNKCSEILKKTVQQNAIQRLADNPDLAEWVSVGIELHEKHNSKKCEYCGQTLPEERLLELAEHFNEAHRQVTIEIEELLHELRKLYASLNDIGLVDKANLYDHLQDDYEKAKMIFEQEKVKLLGQITQLGTGLNDKKLKTHESIALKHRLEFTNQLVALQNLNKQINTHNELCDNFASETKVAKDKLEKHYISTIYDRAQKISEERKENKDLIDDAESKIKLLNTAIKDSEAKIRSSRVACDNINEMLRQFLGRDELTFEDSENGYLIKRDGEPATHLSEGEKSAISFVYFIICLDSDDFDLKEGIVVIDDPISSLDLDAVFRVCSLIKAKLINVHQLILLTHNYEYLNQMKNWFRYDPSLKDKSQFFMVKNPFDDKVKTRTAALAALDPLLRDYESEYHYLFKKMSDYKKDIIKSGEGTIEAVYHYPTIARKMLECFLSFRVPESTTMYVRLKKLRSFNSTDISEEELEDVYNFINSHSHLDTKTGLIQFDASLAKNGEKYIEMSLDLIKKADTKHYEDMTKLV